LISEKNKKVFVTGASGFIGSHLVDRLVNFDYAVTALVRESSNLRFLPLDKIEITKGNLDDLKVLQEGMRGADSVFHLAALVSDWGRSQDFFKVNVEGTLNVMSAAYQAGVKKVILVSTCAVLGEEDCPVPKDENSPYKPKARYFLSRFFESGMNNYRYTKMLAERKAIDFAKINKINLIVIRPPWVYGPREFGAGPFEFCQTVLAGFPIAPMGKKNKFHVIFVKDLAKSLERALGRDLPGVHVFNIGNEDAPGIRQYFTFFCQELDVKPPVYAPFWVMYPLGLLSEIMAKAFKAKKPWLLTRSRVKMFYCNNVYDVSRAKKLLDFVPQTPLKEGIAETVRWWRDNGYLKGSINKSNKGLNQKYIIGFKRVGLDLRMGITIIIRYFFLFLKGEITFKQYLIFIKRIFILAKVFSFNKAVKIGNTYKIHLYLPAFPTPAFYKALSKFLLLGEDTFPTSVVFSMTKACGYKCKHCYQKNDAGEDLPLDKLIELSKDIQDIGTSMFDVEGGEPLLQFERLLALIRSFDQEREVWINTTGHTLSLAKAVKLKEAGLYGVMVSLHHWLPEKHDEFVEFEGAFEIACEAIRIFHAACVATVINCCPSAEMINESGIEKIMALAADLKVSFVQVIHQKPAGGWLGRPNTMMDEEFLNNLCARHVEINKGKKFKHWPSLSMQVFEASSVAFGCTAGGVERFYVNAHGEVQPCEFLNLSCGNVREEEFKKIFRRMRTQFKKPGMNWLCNTESCAISQCIDQSKLSSLPVKGRAAQVIMNSFNKGKEVPLYKKMRICEKI